MARATSVFHKTKIIFFTGIFFISGITPAARAQTNPDREKAGRVSVIDSLPEVGQMVSLSGSFQPSLMQGIKVFPDNPLQFDFIINLGESSLNRQQIQERSDQLIRYFLASLTIPEQDMWVNLSPYEDDRIIPEAFGQTQMGRDLLLQDYLLKQISASLMYPEGELGSAFWESVYDKAYAQYGKVELPVDSFHKVWVTPESATVFEQGQAAFIVDSRLKVMLERDYLALKHDHALGQEGKNAETEMATQILKEIIIPELQYEINNGKNFALLRQIYHCMILATWFKRNLEQNILRQVYVGKNKIAGVDVPDKSVKEKIYQQYLKSYQKGVYNYIKEEYEPHLQQIIPRKYFSGGMEMIFDVDNAMTITSDPETLSRFSREPFFIASANIVPESDDFAMTVNDSGQASATGIPVAEAKGFARRLSEIYTFSKEPLVIRYALQAVGDMSIDVAKEFQDFPDIKEWIFAMREAFPQFIPFGDRFAVSPQERPVDVLFTKDGDAIIVAGQGQTGKGSLVKALNDLGWKDSLKVGAEDHTILFYTGGHAFAATFSDLQNDVRLESSRLSDEESLLKAKFQARAFDSRDFVDVSWTYQVGRVHCLINMEKHVPPVPVLQQEVVNVLPENMIEDTSALPETVSAIIPGPSMRFQEPLKVVTISHNVSNAEKFVTMAKRVYETVTKNDLVNDESDLTQKDYFDLKPAAGAPSSQNRVRQENQTERKKVFTNASIFGPTRVVQEDEHVQVQISLKADIPHAAGKFMAVMDGHGGKRTALLVKERIVSYFKNAMLRTNGDVEAALRFLIQELHNVTKNEKSGTTLSAVYLPDDADKAYIAVIGDSPVIVREKGGRVNYSPPHNVLLSAEERREAAMRGAFYQDGYLIKENETGDFGALQLTRSLGDSFFSQELNREADIYSVDLDQKSFILVASDGVFSQDYAKLEQEKNFIVKLLAEGANAKSILDHAVRKDTRDNITALVMSSNDARSSQDPKARVQQMIAKWKAWSPAGDVTHPREIIRDKNELFAAVLARVVPAAIIPMVFGDKVQDALVSEALGFVGIAEVDNPGLGSDLIVGKEDFVNDIAQMLEDKYAGKIIVDEAYKRKIGEYLGYPSSSVDVFLSRPKAFFQNERDLLLLGWEYLGDFVAHPHNQNRFLSKAWALEDYLIAVDGDEMFLGPRTLPWSQDQIRPVTMDEIRQISSGPNTGQDEDSAMTSQSNVGGIDLDPGQLAIQTTGEGIVWDTSTDFKNLLNTPLRGFHPIILELKPVVNLPLTLGLTR